MVVLVEKALPSRMQADQTTKQIIARKQPRVD